MARTASKEKSLVVSLTVVSKGERRTSEPSLLICCCGLVTQLCPTLFQPMDCRDPWTFFDPGSSVHGISQARILEWFAISFSRGSS